MLKPNEIWIRVREWARRAMAQRRPLFTLQDRVRNYITDVKDGSLGRRSDQGRTNTSRVTQSMVESVWNALRKEGHSGTPPNVLYFTPALMLAALPDTVEYLGDGELALRHEARTANIKREKAAKCFRDHGGTGEGDLHRRLKEYIYSHPSEALRPLGSGHWTSIASEYVFSTGDRCDVVVRDPDGKYVMVEVEPTVSRDNVVPFAQAAKYGILWAVCEGITPDNIRCVVAAPSIPAKLAHKMARDHCIESVAIKSVAANRQDPSAKTILRG